MKVKVTVHVESHPQDQSAAGTEGVIIEFYVPKSNVSAREVADKFRALVDAMRADLLQTPAR